MSESHPDDGKFVLVQNGRRISDLLPNEQEALAEAQKRNTALNENADGKPVQPVQVKRNLLG